MLATEKIYEIYYYDIDLYKNVRIESLINFFQDIFVYRAEQLGRGIDYVSNLNLTWIVSKWDIKIYKFPQYRDKVKIKMTPFSYLKSLMNIQFEVFNEEGELLCKALSLWVLIDIINNKLCTNKHKEIGELYGLNLKDNKILKLEKIPLPKVINKVEKIYTRYSDMDTNNHVNNVKYLEWILRSLPDEILQNYKLKDIKISYKNQCKSGQVINISIEKILKDDCIRYIHVITDEKDQNLVLSETQWIKNYKIF